MERRRPETYEAEHKGRKVRVTVPDAIDEGDLAPALKDNLSPQAVAAIAAYLTAARVKNRQVQRQIEWFAGMLVDMLGVDEFNRLIEEVGL
jgi:hypothetical protein